VIHPALLGTGRVLLTDADYPHSTGVGPRGPHHLNLRPGLVTRAGAASPGR
jgi:hypothetical protein